MKAQKTDMKLGIFVRMEEATTSYDGARLAWLRAVVVKLKSENGFDDSFDFASSYSEISQYEHIKLVELLSTDRPNADTGDVKAFDIDSARASELEEIVKTLKGIERKINAINEQHGRPANFATSVLRLAAAVGARTVITEKTAAAYGRSGNKYHFAALDSASWNVEQVIAAWREKWAPKVVENA